jgi:protein phosphatase
VSAGTSAGLSDPGRRRRRNEDAFVREPPLFAVCDGMGGALAGEVASRLAASALEEAVLRGGDVDLVAAILEGNRRINERSLADPAASGMGTTVTAALVRDGSILIGHVGDSRAYRLRGDRLEQLTGDHSLVAELVRTGQITPQEAESHPQRAVITRALGTDVNVEVDALETATEPGDLYLLCSDGLTVMISDEEVRRLLVRHRGDLTGAARSLVGAANAAGGEDNITVVLFETVTPVDAPGAAAAAASGSPASEQTGVIPVADEDTLGGLDVTAEQTMVLPAPPAEQTMVMPAPQPGTGWGDESSPPPHPPDASRAPQGPPHGVAAVNARATAGTAGAAAAPARRGRRRLPWVIALFVVLTAIGAAAIIGVSRAHFVGADGQGRLVVYQGVPWDVTGSVRLYRAVYISPVVAAQLSQPERLRLFDHDLHSKQVAINAVRAFERELLR